MARSTRSSALESRSARLKLPKRGKPYWVRIARGLSLGYRRIETAGPWIVRKATGKGDNWIKNFAHADDFEDSNADSVLTFFEAQALARTIARDGETNGGLITVAAAIDRYADDLAARGGRQYNAKLARLHLPPALLGKPVGLLTVRDLKHWRDGLLKGRTAGTVNRTISTVRAALELAAATDPRIINSAAFKVGLKKLPDAARARNVVLDDAQVRELVRLAYEEDGAFGLLIEVLAVTGARRSQAARLTVADLQDARPDPRLMMPSSTEGQRRQADRPAPGADPARPRGQAAAGGTGTRRAVAPQVHRLALGLDGPPRSVSTHRREGRSRSRDRYELLTAAQLDHARAASWHSDPRCCLCARHLGADDREDLLGFDR